MNYRADCFGQQIDRAAKNISADGGAGSNASDARGSERGEMPVHRGKTRLEVRDGTLPKSKFVAEIPAGQSEGAGENFGESGNGAGGGAADLARIPEGVRDSVLSRSGEYDARRLRSQREIIRDVMLSAADCESWLTLGELRALTRYGEASISAQLRHLRKSENGGYDVLKRHREGVSLGRPGADGRGERVWEYRITRGMGADGDVAEARLEAVGA